MRPITAILAVLTAVAGWFYLFYSNAASGLGGIEQRRANLRRVRLRRVNGFVMIVLGALLYAGTYAADERSHPVLFVAAWLGVTSLLGVVVMLVLADVRLTLRLRGQLARGPRTGAPGSAENLERSGAGGDAGGPINPGAAADRGSASNPRTPP